MRMNECDTVQGSHTQASPSSAVSQRHLLVVHQPSPHAHCATTLTTDFPLTVPASFVVRNGARNLRQPPMPVNLMSSPEYDAATPPAS